MPEPLVESSSSVHAHVGAWCLYNEHMSFRGIVRVLQARKRRDMVYATLELVDRVTDPPGLSRPRVGMVFEVSASRTMWNQIWTLYPLSTDSLADAITTLVAADPRAAEWTWQGPVNLEGGRHDTPQP